MACVTIKRSHDWDLKHSSSASGSANEAVAGSSGQSPSSITSPAGQSTSIGLNAMSSLSLGESSSAIASRPTKRRCATRVGDSQLESSGLDQSPSPFANVLPRVTANEIATNIREEIRRLQNRGQLHTGHDQAPQDQIDLAETFLGDVFSLEECHSPKRESSPPLQSSASGSASFSPSRRDQPLFTPRQVGYLCERILRARESQIRQEYDRVLSAKLAEQYEAFVKFTHDQVHRRFDKEAPPTYLS